MDSRLQIFIEKFCQKHDVAEEDAMSYVTVRNVAEYYAHVDDGKILEVKDENGERTDR